MQHRGLADDLGRGDALCVVQVGHLPRHLLVPALSGAILPLDLPLSISGGMLGLLVISQLLSGQPEQMCVLIVHIRVPV